MKLTKNLLRQHRIFNSFDVAKATGGKLFISYSPPQYGRMADSANWQVRGLKFQTDPNGPWYNHGDKTFEVYNRQEKPVKLAEAIQWVQEHYGLKITDKDVWGDYHVEGTLKKIEAQLKTGGD
jgi:hypothetical protein